MAIFVTGSTGYLGSYLAAGLLTEHRDKLNLLIRAKTEQEARERLWASLQLHFEFPEFAEYLHTRVRIFRGDLTGERFGLSDDQYHALVDTTDSLIHCAASLNRKSEKQCLNVNLRGTLEVIQLARRAQNRNGLRRYSHVSTVAVAGKRKNEIITEDASIDWSRSDYDPYARTKKFCEHMGNQLLPDVPKTIFRPAIILGDSRRPETSQFDMVQAFHVLAQMPVLPLRPHDKIDIVPGELCRQSDRDDSSKRSARARHLPFVLRHGIADLPGADQGHCASRWHDSAYVLAVPGETFLQHGQFGSRIAAARRRMALRCSKCSGRILAGTPFSIIRRVVAELGEVPAKFSAYAYPLLKFSRDNKFRYPAKPWPFDASAEKTAVAESAGRMTDFLLIAWVSALIEITRLGWMLGLGERWTPGEKLRLLFAGYNGNRNTGSDLRVQETLRQIRHVLGAENVDFSVMTQNFDLTRALFCGHGAKSICPMCFHLSSSAKSAQITV